MYANKIRILSWNNAPKVELVSARDVSEKKGCFVRRLHYTKQLRVVSCTIVSLLIAAPVFAGDMTNSIDWSLAPRVTPLPAPPVFETVAKKNEALRVLIDVGHGGRDLGAAGFFGLQEKELCLLMGKAVRRHLERTTKLGGVPMEVKLSREDDVFVSLSNRAEMANEWEADIFVSIHANSSSFKSARGYEVYFLSAEGSDAEANRVARLENGNLLASAPRSELSSILSDVTATQHVLQSSHLAEKLYTSLSKSFRSNGRGVRQAPFSVLHGTQMPSALVEIGFVSNPGEAVLLTQGHYIKRLAAAIGTGILDYLQARKRFI